MAIDTSREGGLAPQEQPASQDDGMVEVNIEQEQPPIDYKTEFEKTSQELAKIKEDLKNREDALKDTDETNKEIMELDSQIQELDSRYGSAEIYTKDDLKDPILERK